MQNSNTAKEVETMPAYVRSFHPGNIQVYDVISFRHSEEDKAEIGNYNYRFKEQKFHPSLSP